MSQKSAQSDSYYLPVPPPAIGFPEDESKLDNPLPTRQPDPHPVRTGVLLGVMGAGAGATYAGLQRMISQQPVNVARPMLVGAAIGSALGGLLYARNRKLEHVPDPKNFRQINERMYRNLYGRPMYKTSGNKYLGLRLLNKSAQVQTGVTLARGLHHLYGRQAALVLDPAKDFLRQQQDVKVAPGEHYIALPSRQAGRLLHNWHQTPVGQAIDPVLPYFLPVIGAFYNPSETGNVLGDAFYNMSHGKADLGRQQLITGLSETAMRAASLAPGGGLLRLQKLQRLAPIVVALQKSRTLKGLEKIPSSLAMTGAMTGQLGTAAVQLANASPAQLQPNLHSVAGKPGRYTGWNPEQQKIVNKYLVDAARSSQQPASAAPAIAAQGNGMDKLRNWWKMLREWFGKLGPDLWSTQQKTAQAYSFFPSQQQLGGRTVGDLLMAIRSDLGMGAMERAELINQLKAMTGYANDSTQLSALMMKGLGGMIGWLISKYFGMGPVGQTLSAISGYGIGSAINNQLNKPPVPQAPYGFRYLGQ